MDRKKFIISSTLSVFALTAFGSVVKGKKGQPTGDCDTTSDILGPFYRPNAPERGDLTFEGLEGTPIKIKGSVRKPDCKTPLSDALVEIWHCNAAGEYDNESAEFRHRAQLKTNAAGEYAFTTILPGKYLNGVLYRPAHIHFRVTEKNSKELVSQVYFKGDPHIEQDPWASKERAKLRVLNIIPEDIHGNLVVQFDIYLQNK
jgi:catechol 1,2-dioxygenase